MPLFPTGIARVLAAPPPGLERLGGQHAAADQPDERVVEGHVALDLEPAHAPEQPRILVGEPRFAQQPAAQHPVRRALHPGEQDPDDGLVGLDHAPRLLRPGRERPHPRPGRTPDAVPSLGEAAALEMLEHRFAAGQDDLPRPEILAVEEIRPDLEGLADPRPLEPLEHRPGQDARDHEEMRDAVAVDVEGDPVLLFEVDDLPAVIEPRADQLAAFEERDRFAEVGEVVLEGLRQPNTLQPQQLDGLVHPGDQLVAQHARPAAAEQHERRHRRRVGHRREADALDQRMAEPRHEVALARLELRADLRLVDASADQGLEGLPVPAEGAGERDRLAEADVDRAEPALEVFAGAQQPEHALLGLLPAPELVDHPRLLDEPFVVDRDRHEEEIPPPALEEGIDVPREHPEPRREGLAAARSPALDEELLGQPLAHEVRHVRPEDLLVERIVEGAPQEEGAHVAEQEAEGAEGHVLAGRDVWGHEMVLVEEIGEDQEVEIGAMARDEHDRVALRVLGDLGEAVDVDRREEPPQDPADRRRPEGEPGRAHVRRDLAEDLLDLALDLLRRASARRRAQLHRRSKPGIREHLAQHPPARPQRRPLDDLLLAVEVDQDRATDLARDARGRPLGRAADPSLGDRRLAAERLAGDVARVFAGIDVGVFPGEGRDVDRVADLDREAPVREHETRDLREVRGTRQRAVVDVQEAVLRPRPLRPEEREGDEEDLVCPVLGHHRRDDLADQVELVLALPGLATAQERLQQLRAQEEERAAAFAHRRADRPAILAVLDLPRSPPCEPQRDRDQLEQRAVVVEADRVGEAREAQTMAKEEHVEEEVVEPARIAHHVDDAAAGLERLQALDHLGLEREMTEEASLEAAEDEVEAPRHRGAKGVPIEGRIGERAPSRRIRGIRRIRRTPIAVVALTPRHRVAGYRRPDRGATRPTNPAAGSDPLASSRRSRTRSRGRRSRPS